MKHYEPPLSLNIAVRFILVLTGAVLVLISLVGIFGEANLILNGENLNQPNSKGFRFTMTILMLFIGVSCFLVIGNLKYSLAILGLGILAILALSIIHLSSLPNSKILLPSSAINFVIFLMLPMRLFYLEFKRAKHRKKI